MKNYKYVDQDTFYMRICDTIFFFVFEIGYLVKTR